MNKDFLDLITGEITNVTRRHEDGDPKFPGVVEGGKLKFEIYSDGRHLIGNESRKYRPVPPWNQA